MTTAAVTQPSFSLDQFSFASKVAKGTGITLAAVLAWMLAEGGPTTDPLNIQPGGKEANYGSADAAAAATVQLINSSYPSIVSAAKDTTDPTAQLKAIAATGWASSHYDPNNTGVQGTTLIGALARVNAWLAAHKSSGISGLINDPTGTVSNAVQGATSDVGAALGSAEQWAVGTATTGLAYFAFTALGIVLITIGLVHLFGGSVRGITSGMRGPAAGAPGSSKLAAGDEIPF